MKVFETGAVREDKTGKGRCDLLPMCALIRLSKHYEAGTEAHGERNWEKGLPMHSFIDSAIRHLFKYVDGQTDEDHLCAAAWNILGAMWTEEKKPEMQDIPTRKENTAKWCDKYDPCRRGCLKTGSGCTCGGRKNECSIKVTNEVSDFILDE